MRKFFFTSLTVLSLIGILAASTPAKEITVQGKLQKTVESGGWLIAGEKTYLLLNAANFKKESWFKESAMVEAIGETKDVMTSFMEGTPFEARTMRPVEQKETAASATVNGSLTKVTVSGDSNVQATPDTAIISVSVVTQNKRAFDAQQENAAKSDAVLRALKTAAGTGAEVKTSGYSLEPQRVYQQNQPPTITGFEARNSITVTLSDLSKVGPVIDAASQAGSNEISSIAFTLRQDRPARDEALRQATREAVAKAQVIANALGGHVKRIVEVQEEGTVRPIPVPYERMDAMRTAATTPVEVGTLDVTSRVQLIAEIEVG